MERCRDLEEEFEKKTSRSGITTSISNTQDSEETLTYELFKNHKHNSVRSLLMDAQSIDRIRDLLGNNYAQKRASIEWFGEKGRHEHIEILKNVKKYETNFVIKSAITRAIGRIIARREPNFTETEQKGIFQPNRRPWRAMVRVTRVEDTNLWVVLPGWNSEQEIQVDKAVFPRNLHGKLAPNERFFAKVNTGADTQSELYFTDFEDKT